jgi:hypothetical protein
MEGDNTGSDKHLSGEEKRAKLREEYKRELLERKKIQEQLQAAQKMGPIQKALDQILNFNDDTEEWINKLNQSSAQTEARLDIALDSQRTAGSSTGAAKPPQPTGTVAGDTMTDPKADATADRIVEKTLGDVATPGATGSAQTTAEGAPPTTAKKTLGEEEK